MVYAPSLNIFLLALCLLLEHSNGMELKSRMGTKTSYKNRQDLPPHFDQKIDSSCMEESPCFNCHDFSLNETLSGVYVLQRHGSRFPTKNFFKRLADFGLDKFFDFKDEDFGLLTMEGKRELFSLGKRLRQKYDGTKLFSSSEYHPHDFDFLSSQKERVIQSAQSFALGMFENAGDFQTNEVSHPLVVVKSRDMNSDPLMRFHKTCEKFRSSVKKNTTYYDTSGWKNIDESVISKLLEKENDNFDLAVLQSLNLSNKENFASLLEDSYSIEQKVKLLKTLWESLSLTYLLENEPRASVDADLNSALTKFFGNEILANSIEYLFDVKSYFQYGDATSINTEMSCDLSKDILDFFRSINEESKPKGVFRFSHNEVLTPILARLDVFDHEIEIIDDLSLIREDRKWRKSALVPMAANMVFEVHQCQNKIFIRTLLNEHVIRLCDGMEFCSIDFFSSLFQENTCSREKSCQVEDN